jgi:hypothetical protein
MSFFEKMAVRSTRKEAEHFARKLQTGPREDKVAFLLMAYSTRGLWLSPDERGYAEMKRMGISDEVINMHAVRVYHYQKGSVVGINELMKAAESAQQPTLVLGLKVHYFTSLSLTYNELRPAVEELWNTMFEGAADLPDKSEIPDMPAEALSRDVTLDAFYAEPRSITPHFFVPDHPLTKEIEQRRLRMLKMGIVPTQI